MPKAKVILHFERSYWQKQPPEMFCKKKVFLEITQNSQENTCVRVSFIIKFQASVCNFIKKEALAQNTSRRLLLYWNLTGYMLSERVKNTFKNSMVCVLQYSNRTPYLELHSPTKNFLTDVPHKYKKAIYSISIL